MKENVRALINRKNMFRMFVSCVLFFAVALPFRMLTSLLPGITEIRIANSIPPLLGIIWGAPAALGIAIGNLISDIYSGSNAFICVTGFLANFFFAYMPYKMWYTFRVKDDDVRPVLDSVSKILKYIFIILLDSLAVTAILSFIFEAAGFSASADSYPLLFFNNFDFAVLLGVPLLIFLEKFNITFNIPKRSKRTRVNNKLFDSALTAVCVGGLLYFVVSRIGGGVFSQNISRILLAVSFILVYFYAFKPYTFTENRQKTDNTKIAFSIKAKFVVGLLMLAVVFLVFLGFALYYVSDGSSDMLERWMYVYTIMGIAINIIYAVAILFLWYVEKNIVKSLKILTDTVTDFAAADHSDSIAPEHIVINTGDEIEQLSKACNQMMTDITDYVVNLRSITADRERIATELNVATHIQASMLPCIFPAFPDRPEFDVYATMLPAKEVGGDFYDFFLVDETKLAVVIADVSGKGVPAALFMVIAKTLIKNNAQNGSSPKEVFETVNNQLCENNEAGMFVTAFLGILDIPTGNFTYVNAGHNPPLIKRYNSRYEWLPTKAGFILAGMEGMSYKQSEVALNPGDTLFLYTDGVTEAVDKENRLYSEPRLLEVMNSFPETSLKELLTLLKRDIDNFADGADQADDITMLALQISGGAK